MCMICSLRNPSDPTAGMDTHTSGFIPMPEAANPDDAIWTGFGRVTETTDAAASTATTYDLLVGQSGVGVLSSGTDADWFAIELVAGQTYDFRLLGYGDNFLSDPLIRIMGPNGVELRFDDDGFTSAVPSSTADPHGRDSSLTFTATTTGTYYLVADAYSTETGTYMITATEHDPNGMVFTVDEIAWQLINNGTAFFGSPEGSGFNVGADGSLTVNITGLTAAGQTMAQQALAVWSAYTGITFVFTSGAAEITFDDNQSGAFAQPSYSNGVIISSTVNIGLDWLADSGTGLQSYSFETYIHEIGHALGLGHGGNYNGSASYGTDNFYLNDSVAWSIMSYMNTLVDDVTSGGFNSYVDASFQDMYSPMIADMIAIQELYGVSSAFTGNTIWGFGSNTGVAAFDQAVNSGALMAMTIYDTGGIDTLNMSGSSANQTISLRQESLSSVLGGRHNLGIARGSVIENANGGSGNDTIVGNASANILNGNNGNDRFEGGAGNDTINGGSGTDTAVIGVSSSTITVTGNATTLIITSAAGTDTYTGVETFVFSNGTLTQAQVVALIGGGGSNTPTAGNDTLTGTAAANTIDGLAGNDSISGLGGNDTLRGSAGNDTLRGGDANDILYGGIGADLHDGGAGARDRVMYSDSTVGLRADLLAPATNTGIAAGDTYVGVEDLYGSNLGDSLLGNAVANIIWGANGNDAIYGREGADSLYGGAGNDILYGGIGADLHDGGAGVRDRVMYSDATTGLRADLLAPATNTGIAAGDTYVGMEDLYGSNLGDSLLGNAVANMIWGANGNDLIYGREGADSLYGGAGNDILYGGAGADLIDGGAGTRDRVMYSDSTVGLRADLQAPVTNTGIAAGDTYVGVEDIYGSSHADVLLGDGGANVIWGSAGNDMIYGRGGADTLSGGAGSDSFVFHTALGGGNVDTITDYNSAADTILLDDAVFTGLALGTLSAGAFTVGTAATTAAHRIIYNQGTGQLFFDANGSAAGGQILFATLTAGTVINASDFVVF